MNYSNNRKDSQSHSMNHRGAQDIKKGLQKIKLAQIEVLKQLRKDQPDRNSSLTYSKQTTLDSKPVPKKDPQPNNHKNRIQKLQSDISQTTLKQSKLKKQNLILTQQLKRTKQLLLKSQQKMRQYQESEQRALSKARQALSNAIQSQKKYIILKTDYDKIYKQRQRITLQLKRLQKKQITQLITVYIDEKQLINKIVKQLLNINQKNTELIRQINIHKCKKDNTSKNISNHTANTFTISTFDLQQKIDKSINNVIIYLHNINNIAPITNPYNSSPHSIFQSNNYLSGSFHDDIRKIQQQLNKSSKNTYERILDLENKNSQLDKKNKKYQSNIKQIQEQNSLYKNKIVLLVKQLEGCKISKKIIEEQYEKYKGRVKDRNKTKQIQIQEYKKEYKAYQNTANINQNKNRQHKIQQLQQNLHQYLQKISQLQSQNQNLAQKLTLSQTNQSLLKNLLQRLKSQLQSTKYNKQQLQLYLSHQINKLNTKNLYQNNINLKNQSQWNDMIRTISKLQQQKIYFIQRQKQLKNIIQSQRQKYQKNIIALEKQLKDVKKLLQELRKQNSMMSYNQTDLARLRNCQNATRQSLIFNKTVDQLWGKKQGQYSNLNDIIGEIRSQQLQNNSQNQPKQQQQQQPQYQKVVQQTNKQQKNLSMPFQQIQRQTKKNQVNLPQTHEIITYIQQPQSPQLIQPLYQQALPINNQQYQAQQFIQQAPQNHIYTGMQYQIQPQYVPIQQYRVFGYHGNYPMR